MRIRRSWVVPRTATLRAASEEILLDCGDGVRLQSFYADPARAGIARVGRTAVLVHGWEGNAESLYILSLGQQLFERGFDVLRLNLRDHGDTHHLNRELFHSCRLPEVVGAVRCPAGAVAGKPLRLVGFSLGGNFMLRVGGAEHAAPLEIAAGDRRVAGARPGRNPCGPRERLSPLSSVFRAQVAGVAVQEAGGVAERIRLQRTCPRA